MSQKFSPYCDSESQAERVCAGNGDSSTVRKFGEAIHEVNGEAREEDAADYILRTWGAAVLRPYKVLQNADDLAEFRSG